MTGARGPELRQHSRRHLFTSVCRAHANRFREAAQSTCGKMMSPFCTVSSRENLMSNPLKHLSATITDGRDRAPARSMLKAIGFNDDDLAKPIVGIANTWIETMPCNFNLRDLAVRVKEGVRAAGGTPMEFNTIAISDGITMGTEGMKASLVSRELIADSIELTGRGYLFDAMIALVACDKTIPGAAMALARLNIPSVLLYGGTIMPGKFRGRDVTIQDVFEAVGRHAAGTMSDAELLELENVACPGAGACGGQYTANTMATVMEVIGISPMGSASVPATDKRKDAVAYRAGQIVMEALKNDLRPSRILTRKAFETPSPAWPPREVPPTPFFTCSRSRAMPGSIFRLTTSMRSAAGLPCWLTSSPAESMWRPTSIVPAVSNSSPNAWSKEVTPTDRR